MKKLYIIESLRNEDEKTGKVISNVFLNSIFTSYFDCSSKHDVEGSFLQIIQNTNAGDEIILSIEVHGGHDVIQFSDMSTMTWNEVASFLRLINIKSEMRLIVLASACFGQYLDTAITIKDRAPFFKSFGPNKEIEGDTLKRYNIALIRDFIENKDLINTLEQENGQPNKTGAKYNSCDCVELFKKVAIKYYKENLLAQSIITRGVMNMPQIEEAAKEAGQKLEDFLKNYVCNLLSKQYNEVLFYKFIDNFLMTDSNSPYTLEKVNLTFDECWDEKWQESYNDYMEIRDE